MTLPINPQSKVILHVIKISPLELTPQPMSLVKIKDGMAYSVVQERRASELMFKFR